MEKPNSFKLPQSFLSQLNEFTTGYLLVTVNEAGEFETFVKADAPVTRLGLVKFSEMLSQSLADSLDQVMSNPIPEVAPTPDEEDEGPYGSISI